LLCDLVNLFKYTVSFKKAVFIFCGYYENKNWVQSFVVLLMCESIDWNTFWMNHDSTSYKICNSVNAFTTL
jgi:hypothetical protein